MSTQQAQVVESEVVTASLDYAFNGDESTVNNKRQFIRHFIDCHTVYVAASRARLHKSTIYKWRESDPVFARAMDEASDSASDVLETCLFERAKEKSDLLGIFMLKKYRPEFRDRVAVDLNVVHGEIDAMLQQVSERQLPPATTQYVDNGSNGNGHSATPLPIECNSTPSPSK